MTTSRIKRRLATIALVNDAGQLLLQYRGATAPTSPNQWSLPGGGIEQGESAEMAARRELLEETGLQVEDPLKLFWHGLLPSISQPESHNEWYAFSACTQARQEDVIVGEGQAMVFFPLNQVCSLKLSSSTMYLLSLWLTSQGTTSI